MIGLFNECFSPVMDGVSLTVQNYAQKLHQQGRGVSVVTPNEPGLRAETYPYAVYSYKKVGINGPFHQFFSVCSDGPSYI